MSGPPSLLGKGCPPGFGLMQFGESGVLSLSPLPAVCSLIKRSQRQANSIAPPSARPFASSPGWSLGNPQGTRLARVRGLFLGRSRKCASKVRASGPPSCRAGPETPATKVVFRPARRSRAFRGLLNQLPNPILLSLATLSWKSASCASTRDFPYAFQRL